MARKPFDRQAMLARLPRVKYEENEAGEQDPLQSMNIGSALLGLAHIDHESEYGLCRTTAQHLMGKIHEPTELELEG
jgi:hypothetical protein